MTITLKNTDPVNAIITINVVEDDYKAAVEKSLKKFRQQATIPGFRKGMTPMGMIKRMYGDSVLAEEINKLVTQELQAYIFKNKLSILGEPLESTTEQKEIDFRTQTDFEFCFDVALTPQMDIELSNKDEASYYTIRISDEMIDKQVDAYREYFSMSKEVERFSGKDMLKGVLAELGEDGECAPDGLVVEEAIIMPFYMKNEEEKAKFDEAKKGDVIVYNPHVAYEGHKAEIASLLKINSSEASNYMGDFSYEIEEIVRYEKADIDEALFEKVFPSGEVKTEEEFRNKIRESLAEQYEESSKRRFGQDVRELIEKKVEEIQFPEAFLKRWLLSSDSQRTEESLETDFPAILKELKLYVAKGQLVKENDIKLEADDLERQAKAFTKMQLMQYGMLSVSEEMLENYSQNMLQDERSRKDMAERVIEDKLMLCIKEKIKVENKELSLEEFNQLFEQNLQEEKDE